MKRAVKIHGYAEEDKDNPGKLRQKQGSAGSGSETLAKLYYLARIYLHKKRWLLRFSQIIRGFWILGPLRPYAVRYYQRFRRNPVLPTDKQELFPKLDVEQVVHDISEQGYSMVGTIPGEYVAQILNYSDTTGRAEYWNPHKECAAIYRLAHNETVLQIARQYLGAEPVLWLNQLKWSFGDSSEKQKRLPSVHREPTQYDGDAFHYDTLDFKSLTMFIYLTDVDPDSGPHVIIEGTHKTKTFSDLCHIILSDAAAERKFGSARIKMILGPKGTVVLEETSSFHKAARCKTKRLMLSIDYVLQRPPPPERPRLAAAVEEHTTTQS
jgi:hypothetical protein